jgi:hypothetical protein
MPYILVALLVFSFSGVDQRITSSYDSDLFKECLTKAINHKRNSRGTSSIESSSALDSLAEEFLESNCKKYFNNNIPLLLKSTRILRKKSNQFGFYSGIIKIDYLQIPIVNVGREFHYNADSLAQGNGFALYPGKKPSMKHLKDEDFHYPNQLASITYLELIRYALSKSNTCIGLRYAINDKSTAYIGIASKIDPATVKKKRIPVVKIVVIYAAKLLP